MNVRFLSNNQPAGDASKAEGGPEVEIPAGASLYDAAILADVPLVTTCGGKGTCGKCKVLPHGQFNEPTPAERRYLGPNALAAGFRLACQAIPISGARVEVPFTSRAPVILTKGKKRRFKVQANVTRVTLDIPRPAAGLSELDTVREHLRSTGRRQPTFSLPALQKLAPCLRAGDGQIELIFTGQEAVDVDLVASAHQPVLEKNDGRQAAQSMRNKILGMAFDLGTTTVVGYLLDLETGQQMAVVSAPNPQAAYGADVVTRLTFAISDPEGLGRLSQGIRQTLNRLIERASHLAGISTDRIYEASVVGNTAMHHLFLGIHPVSLLFAPYLPAVLQPLALPAAQVGLHIAPAGRVFVLPNIASYVGADTMGVILATGLDRSRKLKLAIDIGTNGEIVLGNRERLSACSTAAGPAFEGARISCGMVAAEGAIDQVQDLQGELKIHTVGNAPVKGICGSGLVDLVALLLRHAIILPDGRFVRPETSPAPASLASRLSQGERGIEFCLQKDGMSGVTLTQKDIRELQLAKGAIRAGIEILLKEWGVGAEAVSEVYLAGAFGNYLRPESAREIGLLPDFSRARITPVGNAAGTGAEIALLSTADRRRLANLSGRIDYVDLAVRPDFQQEFAAAMRFPDR